MDADAGGLLDDAGADLEQAQPEGGELGVGERHRTGDGAAQGEHQPVGCGVQDQPDLVGERALAGGSVRGELALVQLDQVLGLAAYLVSYYNTRNRVRRPLRNGPKQPKRRRIQGGRGAPPATANVKRSGSLRL